MKASKRLIVAIVALLSSIVLCVGAVLAWFAVNEEVDLTDMNASLTDDDIKDFTVTAYYLDYVGSNASEGFKITAAANDYNYLGTRPVVDLNGDGRLDEYETGEFAGKYDSMRPQSTSSATAILFKIDYKIRCNDKYYRIYAANKDNNDHPEVTHVDADSYSSMLSNSVYVSAANVTDSGGVSTFNEDSGAKKSFVSRNGNNYDKTKKIVYAKDIHAQKGLDGTHYDAEGNYTGTKYLIMDYDAQLFSYLLSRVLVEGGTLSSQLLFEGDVNIGIEPYNPNDLTDDSNVPLSIELVEDGNPILSQESSANNVMLGSWRFRVTNRDGSVMTVTSANSGVSVVTVKADGTEQAGLITDAVGDYTARVTYTIGSYSVSREITYSVTANVPIESLTLSKTELTLRYGQSARLTATVLPANSYTGTIEWTSSNSAAVSVSDGVITVKTKSAATATITATATENGITVSNTCTVTVLEALKPQSITMAGGSTALLEGDDPASSWQFTVTYEQTDASGNHYTKTGMSLGMFSASPAVNTMVSGNAASEGKTVTLSYTENGATVTLEVPYTVYKATTLTLSTDSDTAVYIGTAKPDWKFVVSCGDVSKTVTLNDSTISLTGYDPNNGGTATVTYTVNGHTLSCSVAYTVTEAPTTHTVTFDLNGGSGNIEAQTVDPDACAKIPSVNPTRTGYTFAGWFDAATGGNEFNFSTPITENTTVYAHWNINKYTVTFNTHGGSAVTSQEVEYEGNATKPATDPTRTGYEFNNWYTAETGGSVFDFGTKITANTTVHAQWNINQYTVQFNSNGGSSVASQTVNYGGKAEEPTAPTRSGYDFAGWFTAATGGSEFNFNNNTITDNITLYAHWTQLYTVTFDANGGTLSGDATATVAENGTIAADKIPTATRSGYTFDGWFTADGDEITSTYTVTGDVTATARWTEVVTPTGTNLIDGVNSGSYTGNGIKIGGSGSNSAFTKLSSNITSGDLTFTQAIIAGGNGGKVKITATAANVKITVYFTATDSHGEHKAGNVTIQKNKESAITESVARGSVVSKTFTLSNIDDYVTFSSSGNRVAIVGVYINQTSQA